MKTVIEIAELEKETESLLKLMAEKIEKRMLDKKSIVITIDNSCSSCRNVVNIEAYEIDKDYLSLIDGNFELHIDFDDTNTIKYDDEMIECFVITQNDMEIILYFI